MMRRNQQRPNASSGRKRRGANARTWLGAEIELIIRERERLLQAAGAAAALFTTLDPRSIPSRARESVRRLGAVLESLPDETLTDAIEISLAQRTLGRHAY